MPTHASALAIGHQLHEYRIDRLLGHGGFGLTYLAEDTNLNALVAIKEFLPQEFAVRGVNSTVFPKSDMDAEPYRWGLERFKDEARALARFKHPNIVRASRLIEANGTAYMVMDFEPGISLAQYLKRVSSMLSEAEILGIFFAVLDGLEALHAVELVHRDIKPGNIYLRAQGAPMLIDFGAVRHAIGVHSRSLTSMVTAGYAPIEQYSSEGRQGPWSDLYAMGATLYHCMFGRVPVDAARRSAAISEGGDDPYALATKMDNQNARFSTTLLECVDWMLQYRIRDRPQSAAALRERLQTSPVKPVAVVVPTEALENTNVHAFGAMSDRGDGRGSNQSAGSEAPQPVIPDSAVLLRARSDTPAPPAPFDPNETDIRQPTELPRATPRKAGVSGVQAPPAAVAGKAAAFDPDGTDIRQPTELPVPPSAPVSVVTAEPFHIEKIDISSGVDFELFDEPPAAAQTPEAVPESVERSPILEKMSRGIRNAKQAPVAPAPKPQAAEPVSAVAGTGKLTAPSRRYLWWALAAGLTLVLAGSLLWAIKAVRGSDSRMFNAAMSVNTVAAYENYLTTCRLCADRATAAAELQQLQKASRIAQLKTQFETLYSARIYTPPSKPNATDTLLELAGVDQNDPYLEQARSKLASSLKHTEHHARTRVPLQSQRHAPLAASAMNNAVTGSAPGKIRTSTAFGNRNTAPGTVTPGNGKASSGGHAQLLAKPTQSTGNSKPAAHEAAQAVVPQGAPAATMSTAVTGQSAGGSVTPVIVQPRAVYSPAPEYPREAYLNHTQGWVDVQFTINANGTVSDVEVINSHPHIVFDKSARHTVASWRFTPYTVNGIAQQKHVTLRINFQP